MRQTQDTVTQQKEKKSAHNLLKPDSALFTLILASVLTFAVWHTVNFISSGQWGDMENFLKSTAGQSSAKINNVEPALKVHSAVQWVAVARGRVKPKGGEISIRPESRGVIRQVLANTNDMVEHGDIIALIDDAESITRLSAARAEVQVRLAERAEENTKNKYVLEWRQALDDVADSERSLHRARMDLDRLLLGRHEGQTVSAMALDEARQNISTIIADIYEKMQIVANIEDEPDRPASTRLDSGLAIARSNLRLSEIAYEKTRIRATADGMILNIDIKAGEIADPTSTLPLAILGNLNNLEVTAEVEERAISDIKIGQIVAIQSKAFKTERYTGKVISIAPRVSMPGLGLRSSSEPRDIEIIEVDISLEEKVPLLPGMRVDVYFKPMAPSKPVVTN